MKGLYMRMKGYVNATGDGNALLLDNSQQRHAMDCPDSKPPPSTPPSFWKHDFYMVETGAFMCRSHCRWLSA